MLAAGQELDDSFTGLADAAGFIIVAGFGSLLSVTSALSTFPDLRNFRAGKVRGYRRIFAHTASVFFQRGIARPDTTEISSLSCEPCHGQEIVVSLFDIPVNDETVHAFIEREHEFKLVAVQTWTLQNEPNPCLSVLCTKWDDIAYKQRRCPLEEWERRYTKHGIDRVWRDDVLPCRVYLRHCVLAAQKLGSQAHESFLDHTFLADRQTTIRQHLEQNPLIMIEEPPDSLRSRYNG